MRLIKLVTTNFKKLGSVTVEFTDGLNLIAGDNARGKSTLLQAIEAALFGVTVVPGKKEHIPTWGQKDFSLELHFAVGDDTLVLSRNKSTAKLLAYSQLDNSERLVANGNTPVTAAVENILQLAAKDWNLFVQSKQGEATGILTFGAAALNRKVEEFAGVDLIDAVQTRAQRAATLHASYAEAKQISEEMVSELEIALRRSEEEASLASASLEASEQALEAFGSFSQVEPPRASALRDKQRAVERATSALDVAKAAVAAAKPRLDEAKARLEGRELADVEALQVELVKLKKAGSLLAGQLDELKTAIDRYDRASEEVDAALEKHKATSDAAPSADRLLDLQTKVETASTAVEQAVREQAAVTQKVADLTALHSGAKCPTCGHTDESMDLAALAKEIEVFKAELPEAARRVEAARAALNDARVDHNSQLKLRDEAQQAGQAFDKAREKLQALPKPEQDVEQLTLQLEKARSEYSDKLAAFKLVEQQNEEFAADTRAKQKAMSALNSAMDDMESAQAGVDAVGAAPTDAEITTADAAEKAYLDAKGEWQAEHHRLCLAVDSAKQALVFSRRTLDAAKSQHQQAVDKNTESRKDAALAKRYERLVRFIRDRRQEYLREVWTTVMGVSSKLVNQSSKGLITRLENVEGEFHFVEEGILAPASSASGAQKALIGTSLRIGLARALYGSDSLLIFDEPTEGCSEHNASSMAAMLATSAKQTLLITHRETDQALAENIINVGE